MERSHKITEGVSLSWIPMEGKLLDNKCFQCYIWNLKWLIIIIITEIVKMYWDASPSRCKKDSQPNAEAPQKALKPTFDATLNSVESNWNRLQLNSQQTWYQIIDPELIFSYRKTPWKLLKMCRGLAANNTLLKVTVANKVEPKSSAVEKELIWNNQLR